MQSKMEKNITIAISMCDDTARLGIPNIFSIFMDAAAEHAEMIGVGACDMAKNGYFWLTVRTMVRIFERPGMLAEARVSTWPGKPGHVRCERYYTLCAGEKLIAEGKTEWAVMDAKTGKLRTMENIYPEALEFPEETACGGPFMRISEDFAPEEERCTHTVRSTDIDLGAHMNNAAYVRALFGAFPSKELRSLQIKEAEIAFRTPAYEGEALSIRSRETEEGIEAGLIRADGKAAALARLVKGK